MLSLCVVIMYYFYVRSHKMLSLIAPGRHQPRVRPYYLSAFEFSNLTLPSHERVADGRFPAEEEQGQKGCKRGDDKTYLPCF